MDNNFFGKLTKQLKGNKKNKTLLILIVIGISLLIVNRMITSDGSGKSPATTSPKVETLESFENDIQRELETMLNRMKGVGKVHVMVTLDSGPETIYSENVTESQKDMNEKDNQGGERTTVEYNRAGQLVIARKGGGEEPVIIKEVMPKVRGVLVVAEKASNPKVRQEIQRAIQGILDVPAYKISVVEGE